MGEYHPNPNLNNRIFLAKQQNRAPFISDTMYGDDLLKTQGNNFRTNIVIGKRDGIPQDQPIDYFLQRHFQANPYVRGMHPYTSNMLVDVVPSVYNTNPLAGRGGYEKNLASFNGTRPLATALDEPQEIAQRLYEDEFKLSANNPLSMQYTVNHAGVEKRARGEMYDAFRLGIEKNDEGKEPDYDIVLQSKRQKGYNAQGFLPKGENENSISTYFNNQEPLRAGTFKENIKKINTHVTPGPQAAVVPAAGQANPVAAGAVNLIGQAAGQNLPQVLQGVQGMNVFALPPGPVIGTSSAPLAQASINAQAAPPPPLVMTPGIPQGRRGVPSAPSPVNAALTQQQRLLNAQRAGQLLSAGRARRQADRDARDARAVARAAAAAISAEQAAGTI